MATMKDVADEAGVSVTTVSHIINKPSVCKPGTYPKGKAKHEGTGLESQRCSQKTDKSVIINHCWELVITSEDLIIRR